jgi:hypothetical protein
MHHKRLLSGPFRVGARRSPCLQTPLCPPRLPSPGRPGLQPQSKPVRGNRNTCALARPAGRGRGNGTTRPPPAGPPARPPPVHRAQRVERMRCCSPGRSRKSDDKAGRDPPPLPRPEGITASRFVGVLGPRKAKAPLPRARSQLFGGHGLAPAGCAKPFKGRVGLGVDVPVAQVVQ